MSVIGAQLDFENRLIELNRHGRAQTKKIRPIVKMPESLALILQNAPNDHLIKHKGRSVKSVRTAWRNLRAKCKLDDPRNYSLVEYEQAKRQKHDPKAFKKMIQDCWAMSDNRTAFAAALEERGLKLAAGRRGHVAVDTRGEPYAISRYTGLKAKEVRSKLGETNGLPSVEKATALLTKDMHHTVMRYDQELQAEKDKQRTDNEIRQQALVKRQQAERKLLKDRLEAQRIQESQLRQSKLRTGMKGLWDRLTRERKRIQEQNEREAFNAYKQAQARKDDLIFRHQDEQSSTQRSHAQKLEQLRERQSSVQSDLERLRSMREQNLVDLRERLQTQRSSQFSPHDR